MPAALPRWADVDCPNGDTFRVRINGYGTGWQIWDNGEWSDTTLREAYERHLSRCEWLTVDVEAASMYELHPAGTRVGFNGEVWLVGEDGFWRNKVGMEPAGQRAAPPEAAPQHCKGCRCGEQGPPTGRRSHGGAL
jgi:hypothetical protein